MEHCPAPCLGYLFLKKQPVYDILEAIPVTLSLAVGAAVIWVAFGVSIGVVRAQTRFVDRA